MTSAGIHYIYPDYYTTTPDKGISTLGSSAAGWFHGSGHFYKYKSGSSEDNTLKTDDGVTFDSRHDDDHDKTDASGNPCSNSGFNFQFSTNTNTPGKAVGVIATGSRSNLKSWNSTSIPGNDKTNGMCNVRGCTFISDTSASANSNAPYIWIVNMAFIYRRPGAGTPYTYTLDKSLSGINHWGVEHLRNSIYQGGYVSHNVPNDYTFHGIVIQYDSYKTIGTNNRLFNHKIKNLKFIVGGRRNPRTDTGDGSYNNIILEHGENTHTSDRRIYTY